MMIQFGGKTPQDCGAAFVAPNATVLGDVVLEKGSSVWYGAVLRGDDGTLTLGENTNVQDNAVLHCDPGGAVTLGKNVTVGHSALVHGCTVGDGSLIGMHATLLNHCVIGRNCITSAPAPMMQFRPMTLLNHCVIGRNCIIGAGALVPEGMVIPDGSVAVGVPAKIIKTIRPDQAAHNIENAVHYVSDAEAHAEAVKQCEIIEMEAKTK